MVFTTNSELVKRVKDHINKQLNSERKLDQKIQLDHEMQLDHEIQLDQELQLDHEIQLEQEIQRDHEIQLEQEIQRDHEIKLSQGIDNEMKLDAIAKTVGYSKFHLNRLFKEQTGLTIHQYILKQRMQRSIYLLLETDQTVLDIALQSGYTTQQSYTVAFRQMYEVTPQRYRLQQIQAQKAAESEFRNATEKQVRIADRFDATEKQVRIADRFDATEKQVRMADKLVVIEIQARSNRTEEVMAA